MRFFAFLLALLCVTAPAHAGIMNYQNGQGVWQPQHCPKPQMPSANTGNSEAPAAALNRNTVQHNQYVQAVQNYMNCITEEARIDAQASSQTVLNALSAEVRNAQAELDRARALKFMRK